MAKVDWKNSKIFELLQQQIKGYNSAYNLKDICIANQAAPAGVLNDVYYYSGEENVTVFGVDWVKNNSLLWHNGIGFEAIEIGDDYPKYKVGKNLIDKTKATLGIKIVNGVRTGNGSFSCIEDKSIKIGENKSLVASWVGYNELIISFYTAAGIYISQSEDMVSVSPPGTAYVSVSYLTAVKDSFQLEFGTVATAYEPFYRVIQEHHIGHEIARKFELEELAETMLEPIRIESKAFHTTVYASAVKRIGDNGFTVQAGQSMASSLMAVYLSGYKTGIPLHVFIYFKMNVPAIVPSVFFKTHSGAVTNTIFTAFSLVSEGLYVVDHIFEPIIDDTGNIEFYLQVGSAIPPSDFEIYFDHVSFSQDIKYSNGDKSFNQKAIEALNAKGIEPVEIIVSADPYSNYTFKGKNAIQQALDSIAFTSPSERYVIRVLNGIYKITNSSEFIGFPGYPAMILMRDYVDIIGESKEGVVIWAELPYDDAAIDISVTGNAIDRHFHQAVYNYAKDAKLKNVTLVAKNLRYVIHQDNTLSQLSSRYYENIDLVFVGDKGFVTCFGLGTSDGEKNYVKFGRAIATDGFPFSCHNNTNFKYPSSWKFEDFQFIAQNNSICCNLINMGSLVSDELILNGCSFSGKGYIIAYVDGWLKATTELASFNHAEWRIKGSGNQPFLFKNQVNGLSLMVKSLSTGNNSTVRFSLDSTAYNDLIRNPRDSQNLNVVTPSIQKLNGYLVNDGSVDLSGYAFGCCDISETIATYDAGINYVSMGKRLGNCSVVNKTLVITVDGTHYTVTFNKDYAAMTNAAILAEINAVVGAVATASEYCYGREYYPELTDVVEIAINASAINPILKGTVVTLIKGRIRPANEGDKVYGVALEDIPAYSNTAGVIIGQGRVMKKGYIIIDPNSAHFVRCNIPNAVEGDLFKVVAGVLIKDVSGTVTTFDDDVVAINC